MTNDSSRLKRRGVRAFGTLVVLNCLLMLPTWIVHGGIRPQWVTLEAGLVVGAFLLLPRRRWTLPLAGGVSALVMGLLLLEFGDAAARMSLARPLNLYLDVRLVDSVVHLLDGAVGAGWGLVVLGGGVLALVALGVGLARALASLAETREGWRPRVPALALVLAFAVAIPVRWLHPAGIVAGLPLTQLVRDQTRLMARMLDEREVFGAEMAAAPGAMEGRAGLLAGLDGRDVVLAFIESYGISAVEDPRYGPVVAPRLEALQATVEARDLHVVTGVLAAPSQGGMSWLGHGSLLSGLWLENQLRYDLLLASDRPTLVDDFQAAGYRTSALMPAITMAWPEGQRFGYQEIFDRDRIDYAGPPLNWVTMPDQFTWSFMERRIRRGGSAGVANGPVAGTTEGPGAARRQPVFVEMGLISSHAPWTPILEVLPDWEAIGDGAVFSRWADAGERPEELWKDADRVREHYARSVAYALEALTGWVDHYLDGDVLLVALGDHQPAPLITGDDAPRTVPVHVIAADSALLEPFRRWGFTDGTRPPAPEGPPRRMSAFRTWFLDAYSPDPARVTARSLPPDTP